MFARGTDSTLMRISQTAAGGAGAWSAWVPLSGWTASGDPAVVYKQDWGMTVLARGTDNALWYFSQTYPGNWSGSMWGAVSPTGNLMTSDPAVVLNQGGNLEAFARGTDNQLYHCWVNPAPLS